LMCDDEINDVFLVIRARAINRAWRRNGRMHAQLRERRGLLLCRSAMDEGSGNWPKRFEVGIPPFQQLEHAVAAATQGYDTIVDHQSRKRPASGAGERAEPE